MAINTIKQNDLAFKFTIMIFEEFLIMRYDSHNYEGIRRNELLTIVGEQFLVMMIVARRLYILGSQNKDYSRLFDMLESIRKELRETYATESIVLSGAYELLGIELDKKGQIEQQTSIVGERLFSILLSAYETENGDNPDFNYIKLVTSFSTLVQDKFNRRRRGDEARKKKVDALTAWADRDLMNLIVKVAHDHNLSTYENIRDATYGYSISTLYFGLAKREEIFGWIKSGLSIDEFTTNEFQSYLQNSPIPLDFNNLRSINELTTGEDLDRNEQSICFAEIPVEQVIQLANNSELDALAGSIVKKWHSIAYNSNGNHNANVKPVVLSNDEVHQFLEKWFSVPTLLKNKRTLINNLQYHEAIYLIDMTKRNIRGAKKLLKELLCEDSLLSIGDITGKNSAITSDTSGDSSGAEVKNRDGNSASSRQRRYKELCDLMNNHESLRQQTDEFKQRCIPFKFNGLTPLIEAS